MAKVFNTKKADYNGMQLWLNPVDKTVYATEGAPTHSFAEANGYAIYDFSKHFTNQKNAKDDFGNGAYSHDAFVDSEFKSLAEDYVSDVKAGGRQRQAALLGGSAKTLAARQAELATTVQQQQELQKLIKLENSREGKTGQGTVVAQKP